MTDRFAPIVIAIIVGVIIWTAALQWAFGDSRQVCEQTASADVCEWSLNR